MATIFEVRLLNVQYSAPQSVLDDVRHRLPPGAGLPWESGPEVLLRIYRYLSRGAEEGLQLKVKVPHQSGPGCIGLRSAHDAGAKGYFSTGITKVILHALSNDHGEVRLHFSEQRRAKPEELRIEFSCHESATHFVKDALCCRQAGVGCSVIADKAVLVDNGSRLEFCLASKSWMRLRSWPEAQPEARNPGGIGGNRRLQGDDDSGAVSSDALGSCRSAERPCKLQKTTNGDYNSYSRCEKTQLVDLLLAKDEEISDLKGRLEQICRIAHKDCAP